MILNIEIPDNAKNIRVNVLCDGKKWDCTNIRYAPWNWNGINGGTHYCKYFDMDDIKRVRTMTEVATLLTEYGIKYYISRFKKNFRLAISKDDYFNMDCTLKERISELNNDTE